IRYAANVLAKAFGGVSMDGVCDPHCRKITSVDVLSSDRTENVFDTADEKQADECTESVDIVLGVSGTYWACPDEPFPSLFSDSSTGGNVFAEAKQAVVMDEEDGEAEEDETCPVCPEGSVSPSPEDYASAMSPFLAVLNTVCEVTSVEVVNLREGGAAATP
ncbi:MAG: hypothetical protein SGARI_003680, partial [Bacillariaceae sp.]